MYELIVGNLARQAKGMELLEQLQVEEFDLMTSMKTEEIAGLEFSIHELLRQLAVERDEIRQNMQGTRILEYAEILPEEQGERVRSLYQAIDLAEQRCAKQGERNSSLSLSLLDQSHMLMETLYEQITPKELSVYGSKGAYAVHRPQAAIINGRL
ncbi:MAG: flagellar protein FlgN [Desulfovibrionaceae bacterium]|nr:flagellar protein FlgN [Desulfovibrionaceae bacterium]